MEATDRGPTRLHRAAEVARMLRCSEWWVKDQARRRRIPFCWIGGSYRFTDEHVAAIVHLCEVQPAVYETRTGAARTVLPEAVPESDSSSQLRARPPRRRRDTDSGCRAA